MVVYMTFRVKYCTVDNLGLLYRIHIFNFLFSIFTLLSGYIEVIRALIGSSDLIQSSIGLFVFETLALVLAHVVLSVYVCCPNLSLSEEMTSVQTNENDYANTYGRRHRRQTFE